MLAGGGGCFGPPQERDSKLVAFDVLQGYVSADVARMTYRVATDGKGSVDQAATDSLRKANTPT